MQIETAEKMKYYWVQLYNDGTELSQYETIDGKLFLHSFYEIDQTKLEFFTIRTDTNSIYQLEFDPKTMKLIWYWDKYIQPGSNKVLKIDHCMGYQMNVANKQIKVILHISEDGVVTLTSK